MPELLLVSRSINAEALPFFYNNSVVYFSCNWDGSEENRPLEYASEEDDFDEEYGGNVRLMHMLGVHDLYRSASTGVLIELKDRVGLAAHFDESFPPDKQQAWERHIANVEKDSKALGLQGEAQGFCFTSTLELWQ
ncbi:hypothetical protein LTR49_023779 [Elasticomyces elasticus]|nr:hypothetical protein LTR49_023779 [Elasticomyces elasticus]